MNHQEFLQTYLRTSQDIDSDGSYQCVDLAKLYARDVLGVRLGSFGGTALSGWKNLSATFDSKLWEHVEYMFPYTPARGDIIFYSDPAPTGHVAIVDSADIRHVTIIEQNGTTGNGKWQGYDAINFQVKRDYKNCVGWYHKK